MKFSDLGLAESLVLAVQAEGYETPTKIQEAAIPPVLAGRDLFGCAQTGTGKTAAFALPTLQRLSQADVRVNGRGRKTRCLVLAPTRELALQIHESFVVYGRNTKLRSTAIFGGVGQNPQVRALNQGVDILIATPGRLLDLMQQGFVDLGHVQTLVLDEADRMLDMGFARDLKRIVAKVPKQRQTLFFSATMPETIRILAAEWLHDPVDVRVTPVSSTVELIRQSVIFVDQKAKSRMLVDWLQSTACERTLVFTRTKHGADKVVRQLMQAGILADAMQGNKSQNARQRALARFKSSKPVVLVATDIAARGLDVDNVSHVVNFDLPHDPEDYVHRIGRTGRAGATGAAVSFCGHDERALLKSIQRLTRREIVIDAFAGTPGNAPHVLDALPLDSEPDPRDQVAHGQRRRPRPTGASSRPGQTSRAGQPQRPGQSQRPGKRDATGTANAADSKGRRRRRKPASRAGV